MAWQGMQAILKAEQRSTEMRVVFKAGLKECRTGVPRRSLGGVYRTVKIEPL
jgi:hypothetical protein